MPMKGRHQTLGVLYLDTSSSAASLATARVTGKFTGDHLSLAIAIAHQAALAVEETRYHQAMVHAERLAAVGQTTAALSHHIKNILQGLMSGGELIEAGLKDDDQPAARAGLEARPQEPGQDPRTRHGHALLLQGARAGDRVGPPQRHRARRDRADRSRAPTSAASRSPPPSTRTCPSILADVEGVHRALLNIVGNAIDAVEEADEPRIVVTTSREPLGEPGKGAFVRIQVRDNGHGIPADKLADIFRPFVSTKGARGTGLGLAVSRKILREHGGDLTVESEPDAGSVFTLRLPVRSPLVDAQLTRTEIPVFPPPEPN